MASLPDLRHLDPDLLSLCAMLRWFDASLLAAFCPTATDEQRAALLDGDLAELVAAPVGSFRLRAELAERADPASYAERVALRERVLRHFLFEMCRLPPGPARRAAEEEAFHHLEALFVLHSGRNEWPTLHGTLREVRRARPHEPHLRQRLRCYVGSVAIRLKRGARGAAMLGHLLAEAGVETSTRLRALNGLGTRYFLARNRYDLAQRYFSEMRDLARASGNRWSEAMALANLSMVASELGYYDEALELARVGVARFDALGDEDRAAHLRCEVGNVALSLGRWELARRALEEAQAQMIALDLPQRLPLLYWALGLLEHLVGDPRRAALHYRQGLALAPAGSPVACDLLWYLAFLHHTRGRLRRASVLYERALALAEAQQRDHAVSLIHFQRGNLFRQLGERADTRAAYAAAIETIEALRGVTAGEAIKLGLLGTTQQLYEAIILLCLGEGDMTTAFHYVERARARALLDGLAAREPTAATDLVREVLTLAEVQRELPTGALLLEYFTTGVMPQSESMLNQLPRESPLRPFLTLPPRLFCFGIDRDAATLIEIPLDPNVLQPPADSPHPLRRLLNPAHLGALYRYLIAPAEAQIERAEQLYIVPHGPLHYVPWMALRSATGRHLIELDRPPVALVPSATVLLRACLARPRYPERALLALGYNAEPPNELFLAEWEARFLASRVGGEAWTGPEPKGAALRDYRGAARWLHISGHGRYEPHAPLDSELWLGADDRLTAWQIIKGLRLDVNLVTLSTCTSGLTRVVQGDELLGLPRAFLYAGAPAVVCSPWEVPDYVAFLVMERFYDGLLDGLTAAAALRDALLALRAMERPELRAAVERWQALCPDTAGARALIEAESGWGESGPLAEWALFVLIGRADV